MKKIYLLLTVCMLLPQVASASFADVPTSDSDYEEIMDLYNKDIVDGYSDTMFGPDLTITRAELLKIAFGGYMLQHSGFGLSDKINFDQEIPFSDVAGHTLLLYIWYAVQHNIVVGYPDGTFKPNQPVTFAEATKILLKFQEYDPELISYEQIPYFLNDTSLSKYYDWAALQNLYEFSFDEYKQNVGKFALRRDIARAMANIIKFRKWELRIEETAFNCTNNYPDSMTEEEKMRIGYVHPVQEVCTSEEIRMSYAIIKGGYENLSDTFVVYNNKGNGIGDRQIILKKNFEGNNCETYSQNPQHGPWVNLECNPKIFNQELNNGLGGYEFLQRQPHLFNFITGWFGFLDAPVCSEEMAAKGLNC